MPVKKRVPKARPHPITPGVVEAFRKMQASTSDDEWWEHHGTLYRELKLPPWEWPAFEDPNWVNPYPAGCFAALHWQQIRDERPHAFQLYHDLVKASK